jgi:deazaflavin-dependent oxidoreductase (nitroreductase family)
MHLPRRLAQINRRVVNPIQRTYAGVIPGHGIVEHIGRRSGRQYRTPVLVFRSEDGFAIIVGYGLQSDWLRNLLAADGGELRHRGKQYVLSAPQLLTGDDAYAALPRRVGRVVQRFGIEGVLQVDARPI